MYGEGLLQGASLPSGRDAAARGQGLRSRRAAALRTRRLSSLMTTVACWWSVPTTRCRLCAWFRLACARPICPCAFATRRRWFVSASAMPAARASLHSWALSLSVRAIPRAMSRSSRSWPRRCAGWRCPDARIVAGSVRPFKELLAACERSRTGRRGPALRARQRLCGP